MGPGEAAMLPGRPLRTCPLPWGPRHRGSRGREDRAVHRDRVADLEGGAGVGIVAAMPGVSLLSP